MASYHITSTTNGLYGHSTKHCDESGCSGDELYLGLSIEGVSAGDIWDEEITTEEINQLMIEAGAAGDEEQVAICREALYGSGETQAAAVAKCAEAIARARE